ncbi:MAG: DUF1624 domain-containing protein [Williamsia sp.]|nr:DUF1624 domain-containing protein [Williamsia sp.]
MNHRFYSLDIFRGATVALMILVNNPGSWSHIYTPLEHAPWHGCTPTDLVFPFFLFAVGTAMAFTIPRLQVAGNAVFLQKVFKRALLIFGIGLLLNWSPFIRWDGDQLVVKTLGNVRVFGVLQRIAICYLFASLLVYFLTPRQALWTSLLLLFVYWLLCLFLGRSPDPFSLEGFWGTHIDRAMLGNNHIYKGEGVPFDPEGLASSLAAIVQVVAGYFAGRYIRQRGQGGELPLNDKAREDLLYRMIAHLYLAGFALAAGGLSWGLVFPVNKKIWTSSYVLYTSGLAIMILCTVIYLVEIKKYQGWLARFFDVFGKNPLFIFVLSGFLPRLLGLLRVSAYLDEQGNKHYLAPFGWFYEHICSPLFTDPRNASLLYAVCMIIFYWLIARWLDYKKIYIRV